MSAPVDEILGRLREIVLDPTAHPRQKAETAARVLAIAMGGDVEAAAAQTSDPIDLLLTTIITRYGDGLPDSPGPRPVFDVKLAKVPER